MELVLNVNHNDPVNRSIRALICASRGCHNTSASLVLEADEIEAYRALIATIDDYGMDRLAASLDSETVSRTE